MTTGSHGDYERVGKAIAFLEDHLSEQPSLEAVAHHVGLSPAHSQRTFQRWAGVSPKRFLQHLTVTYAKGILQERTVLDAALDAGLSGPSRLHDHFVSVEAMTPGEARARGAGLEIRHGSHPSPFGPAFIATTDRGICGLSFVGDSQRSAALESLRSAWPAAVIVEDQQGTAHLAEQVFVPIEKGDRPLAVLLKGTNFQLQVWRALLRIPPSKLTSYGQVARVLGREGSSRAVGQAVGANPIAYLIPCHRVLRSNGALGGYRWGLDRKRAILARELARSG